MPPKQQPKSKADLAKKQKVVEDKTFGLKNKNKSKNVQKYVQNLQQAVQPKPDSSKVAAKVPFFLIFFFFGCLAFFSYGNLVTVSLEGMNRKRKRKRK